jgi:hypothetical protein
VTFLEQPGTRVRTTTRSFRVDSAALLALQNDSRRFRVSVNTLVNQVLQLYARRDSKTRYLNMLSELGDEAR